MQNLGIINNEYTIISRKHQDSSRISYLAIHNQTKINYIIEFKTQNVLNFPANELNILNILNNHNFPYILRYIGNGQGELSLNGQEPRNEPYIIFENAPKLDLFTYIQHQQFSERHAKLLFNKILKGINFMHSLNICHRDIKPENILFDANYNPKIYGFYFSCITAANLQVLSGTLNYMAPEILAHHQYDGIKADIFSLGQLLFNLVTRLLGFNSATEADPLYKKIVEKKYDEYWGNPHFANINLSQEFKNLFVKMVAYNPNERPTINEILYDVWMNEINNQIEVVENELRNEMAHRDQNIQNQNNPNI